MASLPRVCTGPLPTGQTTIIPTASGALGIARPPPPRLLVSTADASISETPVSIGDAEVVSETLDCIGVTEPFCVYIRVHSPLSL
jgi:hypothetical protein